MKAFAVWAPGESDERVNFILKKSFENASVNFIGSLEWSLRDRIECLEDSEVIGTTVSESDPQEWNTMF